MPMTMRPKRMPNLVILPGWYSAIQGNPIVIISPIKNTIPPPILVSRLILSYNNCQPRLISTGPIMSCNMKKVELPVNQAPKKSIKPKVISAGPSGLAMFFY